MTRIDLCRRVRKDGDKKRKSVRERGRNGVKGRVRKGEKEVARRRQDKLRHGKKERRQCVVSD